MIWRHFGKEIIEMFILSRDDFNGIDYKGHIDGIHREIYYRVILEIDANDNGIPLTQDGKTNYKESLNLPSIIDSLNYHETYNDVEQLSRFHKAVKVCGNILDIRFTEIISKYFSYVEDIKTVRTLLEFNKDKYYLLLPKRIYTIFRCIRELDITNKIKFIIFPALEDDNIKYYTIRTISNTQDFQPSVPLLTLEEARENLEKPEELLFVHKNLFVAKALK